MTLNDLKTGMYVKNAKGDIYFVLRNCNTKYGEHDILFIRRDGFTCDEYNEDLTHKHFNIYNIVAVGTVVIGSDYCHKIHSKTLEPLFSNTDDLKFIWIRES